MKKQLLEIILILFCLPHILFAENTTDKNSFSSRIAAFSEQLTAVKSEINMEAVNVELFLTEAPVSKDNIEEQLARISKGDFNKEKALAKAQKFADNIQQKQSSLAAQQSKLAGLQDAVAALTDNAQKLGQHLDNPVNKAELSPQEQQHLARLIKQAEQLFNTYEARKKALADDQQQLTEHAEVMTIWISALAGQFASEEARQVHSQTHTAKLARQKLAFEKEAAALQTRLDKEVVRLSNAEIVAMQKRIDHTRTQAWLAEVNIKLADIIVNCVSADAVNNASGAEKLAEQLQTAKNHISELKKLQAQLNARAETLKKYDKLMGEDTSLMAAIDETKDLVAYQLVKQEMLPKRISDLLLIKNEASLFSRQHWRPEENLQGAGKKGCEAIIQTVYQLKISVQTLWKEAAAQPGRAVISGLISIVLFIIGLKLARKLARAKLHSSAYDRWVLLPLQKIITALSIMRHYLALAVFITMLLAALKVPGPSDGIIQVVMWGLFAALAGLVLLVREARARSMSWPLAVQGYVWFAALTAAAMFYRLFCLSLVDSKIILLSEKIVMVALIGFAVTSYRIIRYYVRKDNLADNLTGRFQHLLTRLPLIGALIGLTGLTGYQQLAWLVLNYLVIFNVFGVMLVLGLAVIDYGRKYAKLYSIKHFSHGVFIAQDMVSPLAVMLKFTWAYVTILWLSMMTGLNSSSYLITQVLAAADYPLITIDQAAISSKTLFLSITALYLLFRAALWLKRFTYQWLFARIADLGVRNSLSIFAQYLSILFGVLVVLKFMHIDLTSLAVFAGALGVGVGIGLQDIAKNFISGIILLIERPLRTGDWVILDGSEGYVSSIGLRAITMETFDRHEVIVPNSNVISGSFTNYTYSSDINRTLLFVGTSYSCPPKTVIELLTELLADIDEVLAEPGPRITLWEYADSSINYRIQYYINVNKNNRNVVKTKVLSAIWYAFEENGIEMPFPQRDINFRNMLTIEGKSEQKI